jgi:predicted RNA binding protein YcfA (HicA-like mRNA interferase family)
MPRKIRQLIADLKRAGFKDRGGKGSHRNFLHEPSAAHVTVSGNEGADAHHYQEKQVKQAIADSKKKRP